MKGRDNRPEADTRRLRPDQLVDPARSENAGEAVMLAVANLLVVAREVAKGPELRALQEHCAEFLEDTGWEK